jgi:hypothetical protein
VVRRDAEHMPERGVRDAAPMERDALKDAERLLDQ